MQLKTMLNSNWVCIVIRSRYEG